MPVAVTLTVIGLYVGCLIVLASWIRSKWSDGKELSRKIIHIGSGFLLPISFWLQLPRFISLTAALIATVLVILNYQRSWFGLIEDVDRKTYGTIFYCVSISGLIFFFWEENPLAMLAGSLVMALSDGLASLIGKGLPSPKWTVQDQTKSLAGTTTMLLTTSLVLLSISQLTGCALSIASITIISFTATILEQWSIYGVDNLTVPMSTALMFSFMERLVNSSDFQILYL